MSTSAGDKTRFTSSIGGGGHYFTKFTDERWSESRNRRNTFMFRDQAYPSASAALEVYILDYEGTGSESSFLKSQRYSSDVDKLLSSQIGSLSKTRRDVRKAYRSASMQSKLAPNVSMTLEESRRVLNRIESDELDAKFSNPDACSAITDDTDILLQAKPYPHPNSNRLKKSMNSHFNIDDDNKRSNGYVSRKENTLASQQKIRNARNAFQAYNTGAPSWVQELAKSEVSFNGDGDLMKNRRLWYSQPKINTPHDETERNLSSMSRALSLNDLNHYDLQTNDTSSCLQSTRDSKQNLQEKLLAVEKRNRILRQLLHSHNIIGQGTVLKPVSSKTSDVPSTPEVLPAGRSVHFELDTAEILTSTFQNTPKKLTVDVSSIESANSIDPQQCSFTQMHKRSGTKKESNATFKASPLTDETARIFVSGIHNENHKQYLNSLIKDIEDSSSSVVTTPWLEVLQRDLGMKVGEVPTFKSEEEREALSREVEEIIRTNTLPSNGSVEKLLVSNPEHAKAEQRSRESLDTERILDGDRTWEAPILSLKKPVCVDMTAASSQGDKSRLVDRFLDECMGTEQNKDKSSGQQPSGPMETLKNMLFSIQAMASEDEVDDNVVTLKGTETSSSQLADLEIQKIVHSAATDMATAQSKETVVPDNMKHLLSVSFDAQIGIESLDKAMTHLKNLQSLVQMPTGTVDH